MKDQVRVLAGPVLPQPWVSTPIHGATLPQAGPVNAAILTAFRALTPGDFDRRSHLIQGRFENLYLARERLPTLAPVLRFALDCAARILDEPAAALRCGFWFNAMEPGQSTSRHTHDENGERLAAVYYVEAPPDSGDLILYDGHLTLRVTPAAGSILFFPPDLPHAVEPNRSGHARLSIGINVGLICSDD